MHSSTDLGYYHNCLHTSHHQTDRQTSPGYLSDIMTHYFINYLIIQSHVSMYATNYETANAWRRNFAGRPISYLCIRWAGSNVDRGHHWEENCTYKTTFQAFQLTAATWMDGRLYVVAVRPRQQQQAGAARLHMYFMCTS